MALDGVFASGFQEQRPSAYDWRFQVRGPIAGHSGPFDPLNVRFIGNWPFGPSYTVTYDKVRNLVFCGAGGGVYILDVSNPSSPVKVSEAIHSRGIVYGLFYDSSNQRLYIAGGQGGFEIWDVSNPSSPYKLGHYFTPGYALGVYILGSYAYVADDWAGLRIINVSNPSSPYEVGYYDTPASTGAVYVLGSYTYVAIGYAGLEIYQYCRQGNSENTSERLSQVRLLSNPVQKNIELSFGFPLEKGMEL